MKTIVTSRILRKFLIVALMIGGIVFMLSSDAVTHPSQARVKTSGPCEDACSSDYSNCTGAAEPSRNFCYSQAEYNGDGCKEAATTKFDACVALCNCPLMPGERACENNYAYDMGSCELDIQNAQAACDIPYYAAIDSCANEYSTCLNACSP